MRVIMALPEFENINLADLKTARSRRGSESESVRTDCGCAADVTAPGSRA